MPWHLDANKAGCSGVAVVKDADGSIAGCHPTQAAAKAQLAALYANEPDVAAAAMTGPVDPTSGMEDPQVLQDEFADAVVAPPGPDWVPDFEYGAPCWGIALAEGIPDGSTPRRMFEPGAVTFAPTPFSIKWQPQTTHGGEGEADTGAVVVGRIDAIWRDGSMVRWVGALDSEGAYGAEVARLIEGQFLRGVSPMTDDIDQEDIELIFEPGNGPAMSASPPMAAGGMEVELEAPEMEMPEPEMVIFHAGRIRSLTILPEQAFVEACIWLGSSPYIPPPEALVRAAPGELPAPSSEEVVEQPESGEAPMAMAMPMTAAAYTLTIPDLWPERWFQEPSPQEMAQVASGAIQVTPEGRVWGLLAPAGVDHRGFRGSGRLAPQVPRGIDYSEWQNKGCIVAGADGNAYKINAGTVTFDCGHASPTDPRRADPAFASQHYDNSCSVAMRARCGENRYGTWFAGGLVKGLTASSFQQIMGCALSGDWQGGKLKAALLVPVEGFPQAVTASVRERMGTLVASSVPIVFDAPKSAPAFPYEEYFALVAAARFAELAAERFDELAHELGGR